MLLPEISILLFCVSVSWYCIFVVSIDALLAPILKLWLYCKPFLIKTLPAALLWLWAYTGAKLLSAAGELIALLGTLLGGWKVWSTKKLARQIGRFMLTVSARFVAISVLLSTLYGDERRGVRLLPRFALHRLRTSWTGPLIRYWTDSSERKKRLLLGALLCLVLILAGQVVLGISVLLFDLVWELLLIVWRTILRLLRFLGPLIMKLVPNFIGNFFTRSVLPFFTDMVPIIKDDHRVIYLRFNIRRHIRRFKAWLYLRSRARRRVVRTRVSTMVSDNIRARKKALLDASLEFDKRNDKNKNKK